MVLASFRTQGQYLTGNPWLPTGGLSLSSYGTVLSATGHRHRFPQQRHSTLATIVIVVLFSLGAGLPHRAAGLALCSRLLPSHPLRSRRAHPGNHHPDLHHRCEDAHLRHADGRGPGGQRSLIAVAVLLMVNYVRAIPRELFDAMTVDGARRVDRLLPPGLADGAARARRSEHFRRARRLEQLPAAPDPHPEQFHQSVLPDRPLQSGVDIGVRDRRARDHGARSCSRCCLSCSSTSGCVASSCKGSVALPSAEVRPGIRSQEGTGFPMDENIARRLRITAAPRSSVCTFGPTEGAAHRPQLCNPNQILSSCICPAGGREGTRTLEPPDCQVAQYRRSPCRIVPHRRVLAHPGRMSSGSSGDGVQLHATLRDGFVGSNVGFLWTIEVGGDGWIVN